MILSFLFTKSLTKHIMTQHHIDGKTTKSSAFSQIIEKDSQGVKTLKWSKTPQKYLDKKDNFWLKMLSRRITTWQTCHKLKRSTYAKKCKSILAMFTSNYNPYTTKSIPCYGIHLYFCATSPYVFVPFPPSPSPHIISFTTTSFSNSKQCFLWT